jgi:hypothetical protein
MLQARQWMKVPPGASGSSIESANERVPFGGLVQRSAGETFCPSQVNFAGIAAPALKAGLVSVKRGAD